MSDYLQLPVDKSIDLNNGSYKNPGRIIIRSQKDRTGWEVYYCLADGYHAPIGRIKQTSNGTAIKFSASVRALGVNTDIANLFTLPVHEIHDAPYFWIFAVSPSRLVRTRVHQFHNDKYVPKNGDTGPPWQLQANGFPKKVRGKRGIFDRIVDFPPDYQPNQEPQPPEEPPTEPTLEDVELAEQFRKWRQYKPTIALDRMSVTVDDHEIRATWSPSLDLPRWEGGRFGRLCWIAKDGGWIGGHGEHLRTADGIDESGGAAIHAWAEDGMSLGETLAAKSKLEITSVDSLDQLGLFIVTHDANPNPQRSEVFWFGESFEDEPDPPDEPDQPSEPSELEQHLTKIIEHAQAALTSVRSEGS